MGWDFSVLLKEHSRVEQPLAQFFYISTLAPAYCFPLLSQLWKRVQHVTNRGLGCGRPRPATFGFLPINGSSMCLLRHYTATLFAPQQPCDPAVTSSPATSVIYLWSRFPRRAFAPIFFSSSFDRTMIFTGSSSLLRRTAIAAARTCPSQAPASLAIASTSISASSSVLPAFAFGGSIQTRNSTKRGGGSTKNNRNSPGKRLGYKKQTGQSFPCASVRCPQPDVACSLIPLGSSLADSLFISQVNLSIPVRSSTGSVAPRGTQAPT